MTVKAIIEMMDKLGFSDNIRYVQYKEIVDYNKTYTLK